MNEDKDYQYGSADFKVHCLEIMERVAQTGEEVYVTKRGKPSVRIVPAQKNDAPTVFGFLRGSARLEDDLFSTGESWNAEHS